MLPALGIDRVGPAHCSHPSLRQAIFLMVSPTTPAETTRAVFTTAVCAPHGQYQTSWSPFALRRVHPDAKRALRISRYFIGFGIILSLGPLDVPHQEGLENLVRNNPIGEATPM